MSEARHGDRAIDRYLPVFDVRTSHAIEVDAAPDVTYRAARDLDVGGSLPIQVLLGLRGLPRLVTGKVRLSRSITLETFLQAGFTILEERSPTEFVMGTVGRFWRPAGGLVRIAPEDFERFDEPGYAKGVLSFQLEGQGGSSLLETETRVACTDASARRRFSLYWRVVGPFSGLIRRLMLEEVKRSAEKH